MTRATKRLYRTVSVMPAESPQGPGERGADRGSAHLVCLDRRAIKTPRGRLLAAPSAELAEAIADEWRAQAERIDPAAMPLTQLTATALDRVAEARAQVIEALVGYAAADLLCYRAAEPAELAARQHACWQPLLDWAAVRWGAALSVTQGIVPLGQPADAIEALRAAVEDLDDWELTALASAAPACGSLVIGLALLDGRIEPDEAFELSQLDESYQIERWGEDFEAARRRQSLRDEVRDSWTFVTLRRAERGCP